MSLSPEREQEIRRQDRATYGGNVQHELLAALDTLRQERDSLSRQVKIAVEALEAANRQLWDKDDALTKLHRRISELEAALAESRKKVEELEDRLNDIHIHNLERD